MNILLDRIGALGDVLEVTPVAKRLHDEGHTVFVKTNYPQVFRDCGFAVANPDPSVRIDRRVDLNGAFETSLRRNHPVDDYSDRVFGDWGTEQKIYFNFPAMHNLVINGLALDKPICVVHPARSWAIRTLSRQFWQDLIDDLTDKGFEVVLTGTWQDWDRLDHCYDLRNALDLQQQASLISYANVFICSESGPMILAQATFTPIIALLTMVEPHRIIHQGVTIACVRARVPCVGCESTYPNPVTYIDCKHGPHNSEFRACVRDGAFDIPEITHIATQLKDLNDKGRSTSPDRQPQE